jgi:hypothetical protein
VGGRGGQATNKRKAADHAQSSRHLPPPATIERPNPQRGPAARGRTLAGKNPGRDPQNKNHHAQRQKKDKNIKKKKKQKKKQQKKQKTKKKKK